MAGSAKRLYTEQENFAIGKMRWILFWKYYNFELFEKSLRDRRGEAGRR
jgi:hypothetical protein